MIRVKQSSLEYINLWMVVVATLLVFKIVCIYLLRIFPDKLTTHFELWHRNTIGNVMFDALHNFSVSVIILLFVFVLYGVINVLYLGKSVTCALKQQLVLNLPSIRSLIIIVIALLTYAHFVFFAILLIANLRINDIHLEIFDYLSGEYLENNNGLFEQIASILFFLTDFFLLYAFLLFPIIFIRVFAVFAEELLFRGIFLPIFCLKYSPVVSSLYVSLLFAIGHIDFFHGEVRYDLPSLFFHSLLYCYLYFLFNKNVFPSFVAHFIWNIVFAVYTSGSVSIYSVWFASFIGAYVIQNASAVVGVAILFMVFHYSLKVRNVEN